MSETDWMIAVYKEALEKTLSIVKGWRDDGHESEDAIYEIEGVLGEVGLE